MRLELSRRVGGLAAGASTRIEVLARMSHQVATATAHLRTLARDFGLRLLDTPPVPKPEISRQSTNPLRLATQPGEISGLVAHGKARARIAEKPAARSKPPPREEDAV